jgi:peptidoglycan hydrolase-like protein with peptidoglycan-binding domain
VASEGISPGKVSRSGRIARKAAGSAGDVEGALARVSGSTGAGLPQAQRAQFEHSLGADLSAVRVHTGEASASAASELGARAFATGNDVHFGAGEYQPGDPFGLHLLAHEVAHTVQQGGAAGAQAKREVSEPGDPLEREADAAADAMVRGAPAAVTVGAPGAIGRVHRFGFGELSGEPAPAASMPLGEVQPTAPASTPGGGGGGSLGDATLAVGSSGAAVEELQRRLTAAGHACTVDGRFGPGTRAAVVAFQRAHGLVADGVVGAKTRAALASGGAAAGAAVAGPAVDPVAGPVPAGPSAGPVPAGPAATPAEAPPEHAADKAIANPVRQAIVMAARSKLGTVESNTPGEPDATGDKTRKGWETLTEIFEVAYPEFPKQIIKYIKWGKNSENTNGPRELVRHLRDLGGHHRRRHLRHLEERRPVQLDEAHHQQPAAGRRRLLPRLPAPLHHRRGRRRPHRDHRRQRLRLQQRRQRRHHLAVAQPLGLRGVLQAGRGLTGLPARGRRMIKPAARR